MQARLDTFIEQLEQAQGLEGIQRASEDLRDILKISHIAYHWVDSAGDQYGCGTYSKEWQQRYIQQGYIRVDPVILGCYQRFHPVEWKKLDWSPKGARAFFKEALDYGLGNQGFSVPIRGPNGQFALFTANHSCPDDEWELFTEEHRRSLILLAHYFNDKALALEPDRIPDGNQLLSPREIDAMTFIAMGYSRSQVADTLSISEHTLRVYIESARCKLGALNTTHAVARAMNRGLIVI
jgi:DNA-binding CsgD family transcriptional regulator